MLAPFLILLSAYLSRSAQADKTLAIGIAAEKSGGIVIPWFALGFVAVAGINSFGFLPKACVEALISVDTVMLTMAMSALGLTTHISAIRTAGLKPLALSALLFTWLMVGGIAVNVAVRAVCEYL